MIQWFKEVLVDLIATVVIAAVVFFQTPYLEYAVFVYTGLMAVARSLTLLNRNFRDLTARKATEAPAWIFHILYFLNVAILAYGAFYITAAAWVYIWGAAYYVYREREQKRISQHS
jgi:hypothetical protein